MDGGLIDVIFVYNECEFAGQPQYADQNWLQRKLVSITTFLCCCFQPELHWSKSLQGLWLSLFFRSASLFVP